MLQALQGRVRVSLENRHQLVKGAARLLLLPQLDLFGAVLVHEADHLVFCVALHHADAIYDKDTMDDALWGHMPRLL